MFTGIVTDVGEVLEIRDMGDRWFRFRTAFDLSAIPLGSSIACSGVCLTVIDSGSDWFAVTASAETLARTTMKGWTVGTRLNLERALRVGDELGGHLVSGHVDDTAVIAAIEDDGASERITFRVAESFARYIAPKGSVAIDGISLTVNTIIGNDFCVNIIPHTLAVTTLGQASVGDFVNLEVDLLARYVARQLGAGLGVNQGSGLSPIQDIIEDARNGRMFILVDDEHRENEGDLVVPAQMATPDAVNFMARFGRGLICLALTRQRVGELKLPLMPRRNTSRHETAFTVSIEAREGVSTGISASDRARTIATAIDPGKGGDDLVSPGHVFPLEARDGGVLVRAGHTEAAVDIARLAGLNPSGVICEIMNDDGTMARTPDLLAFARRHGLKVATIADLIAYRLRHDRIVERILEDSLESIHGGDFRLYVYLNRVAYAEHLALVKGDISADGPILVRMHALNVLDDVLGDVHSGKAEELQGAMRMIGEAGRGVLVLIREPYPASLSDRVRARLAKSEEHAASLRDYGIGAQILVDIGVRELILLSNTQRTVIGLQGYGLSIAGQRPISTKVKGESCLDRTY